jgi:hypothetical protein
LAAIYVVALHTILLGIVPMPAGSVVGDPLSVICHSDAQAAGTSEQAPDRRDLIPGSACDHCTLCSVSASPPVSSVTLNGTIVPPRVTHVLRPASAASRIALASDPKLARGPPRFA